MKNRKFILSILVLTLIINVCHDFLPYHIHAINHFFQIPHEHSIDNVEEHDCNCENHNQCNGHDLCIICFVKDNNSFQYEHQEINFSILPTNIILQDKNDNTPDNYLHNSFKNNHFHRKKSKYLKHPRSFRAPPFLV